MSEHICPRCGEVVTLDNYHMVAAGTVKANTVAGYTVQRQVYRMAHFTCPVWMGRKQAKEESKSNG